MKNNVLYRPVGINELNKIIDLKCQAFPPRLMWQPIFYPVLNVEYAEQIARRWNARSDEGIGFVTRFAVDADYLRQFEVQIVGGPIHQELWVPAEELDTFNCNINGKIEIIAVYYGETFDKDRLTPRIKKILTNNSYGNE